MMTTIDVLFSVQITRLGLAEVIIYRVISVKYLLVILNPDPDFKNMSKRLVTVHARAHTHNHTSLSLSVCVCVCARARADTDTCTGERP